ncbi:hypothetical protein ACQ86D_44970 [Streptomyces galilaeus]
MGQATDALGDGLRVGSVRQPQVALAPGTELAARPDGDAVRGAQYRHKLGRREIEVVCDIP